MYKRQALHGIDLASAAFQHARHKAAVGFSCVALGAAHLRIFLGGLGGADCLLYTSIGEVSVLRNFHIVRVQISCDAMDDPGHLIQRDVYRSCLLYTSRCV